jgi:uncharacterized protein (AIM24 family)
MTITSVQDFLQTSIQKDASAESFELESPQMLEVKVNGRVWAKAGSMVAQTGSVTYTRQGLMEQGLGTLLKKAISGEGMALMKVEGKGRVYLADKGKKVRLLRLNGETFFANGNDVLAYQDGIQTEITMMRRAAAMLAGGLFNIRLSGKGIVAITSHYDPLTLPVTAATGPVFTDPNATVAWSGSLTPDIVSNVTVGTMFGRGSGEAFRMKFQGEGWVVVQPYEEVTFQHARGWRWTPPRACGGAGSRGLRRACCCCSPLRGSCSSASRSSRRHHVRTAW